MIRKNIVVSLAILVVCLLLPLPSTQAQEEEDLGAVSLQVRRMLETARGYYDSAEFAQAIQALDRVLAGFDTWAAGTLPVEEEEVRVEAYRLRGLAYYNLGQADAARADFAVLLRQQPDLQLDRNLLSPKILAAFDAVREEVTGLLVVGSDPPGAEVRLGGRVLGVTPLAPVRIPVGRYLLDVKKRGFSLVHESIEVQPGKTTEQDYLMHRNARSVTVMTLPAGARVSVDGTEIGTTSGSPPPGYEIALMEDGLNPEEVSAPLTLPFLSAGRHVIKVEKPCFETLEGDFTVSLSEGELPMELETIVMNPSRSELRVISTPSDAFVEVDGRHVGSTPLELEDLCGEDVLVKVRKDQVGTWEGRVPLRAGERSIIDADLKLSLVSLGAVREVGVENPAAAAWDDLLEQAVNEQTVYARRIPAVTPDGITPAHLELFRVIQAAGQDLPVIGDNLRRRLADEVRGDLFLVAVPEGGGRGVVYLFGLRRAIPDVLPLDGRTPRDRQTLVGLLNAPSLRKTTWSGLVTVETAESDFPFVIGRSPSAPDGTSVLAGDRVRSVDGTPVVSRRELEASFAARKAGSRVPVTVERGSARVETVVVAAETPIFSRPGGEQVLINKVIADLVRYGYITENDRERSLAAFGLGIAFLMSGEPERALVEGFEHCKLPAGAGISAGSVDYLRGVSLEALGAARLNEAGEAFRRAAGEGSATLWRDDGPLVAPLAAARDRGTSP